MINRLASLQEAAAAPTIPPARVPEARTPRSSSRASGPPSASAAATALLDAEANAADFLSRLDVVLEGPFRDLKLLLQECRGLHTQALESTSLRAEQEALTRIEQCIARITEAEKTTSFSLKALNAEASREGLPPEEQSMRKQSVAGASRLFQHELKVYFKEQAQFRENMEAKVTRQLRAAVPDVDDQVIAAVMTGQRSAARAIQDTLSAQPGIGPLSPAVMVQSVHDRHSDLERLRRATEEQKQTVAEFEVIVNLQGEMLDDISQHIAATRMRTEAGVQHIERSRDHHRAVCKWKVCVLCVLVLGVGVILIVTLIQRKSAT